MTQAAAKQGYTATSVSTVAALAHVARPVFYRAFPGGKDECLLAAYDATVDRLSATVSKAYEAAGGGLGGVEAALRSATMQMARSPEMARLCLIEITALGVLGLKHRDATLAKCADLLDQTLAHSRSGTVSRTKIRALVGGCYQLLYLTVAEDRAADLPALVPDMLYMILAYKLGPQKSSSASASVAGA